MTRGIPPRVTRSTRQPGGPFASWTFRIGAVVLLYTVLSGVICWNFVAGYRGGIYSDPAARGIEYKDVSWPNEQGQTIRGIYAATEERPVVILAHGRGATYGQFSALFASLYLHCRLGVLAFDFRAYGKSDGSLSGAGSLEAPDLIGAVHFLTERGVRKRDIAVVAYDMGGIAALGGVQEINKLGALVLIAAAETPRDRFERAFKSRHIPFHPTATLAFEVAKSLTQSRFDTPEVETAWRHLTEVPVLLIGGELDEVCPPDLLKSAFARIPTAKKQIEILTGEKHATLVGAEARKSSQIIQRFLLDQLVEQ